MTGIVIVDDDPLVAESLKTILSADPELKVLATGGSGEEAVQLYNRLRPDVLLLDIRMQGMDGIEAARRILARRPEAGILFLTTFSDDEYIVKALKMGARGYLLKQNYESIAPAIKAAALGQRVFGEAIADRLPDLISEKNKETPESLGLSLKEYTVMCRVAEGLSNREIGNKLNLGEGTVRNYISVILEKLDLRDRTQLAIFYHRHFQ